MSLTTAQLQALKADIAADPAFSALPHNSDSGYAVARAYNLPATPDFYVWKSGVTLAEIMGNGFDWARVDNLSVGKGRIWEWMGQQGTIDPSRANVRAGIVAVWVGTQPDLNVRLAVFGHCQRLAKRAEKLFATGAGTAAIVDGSGPAVMGYEGEISFMDVLDAWGS
jgi:hypothetical protein